MRVVVYGDSLTEGWPGAAFMPLLQRGLAGHRLVNRGRAGDTTADLLARLRRHGVDEADVAVVWIGANDAFAATAGDWLAAGSDRLPAGEPPPDWRDVAAATARSYDLVLGLVAPSSSRLLLVPPVAPDDDLGEPFTSRFDDLARLVEAAAQGRPRTRYVDLRPAFADAAGPFTIDGVHLNGAGATVVADALAAAIMDAAEPAHG